MLDVILGACGLAFLACSFYILLLNRTQREVVLERLHLRRRRATNSLTPPRSLSPEKQESALDKPSPTPDYSDVFPPSRRHVLAELPADALNGPGESARELGAKDADYLKRVPSCEATDTEDLLHHTTPTGFTVSEVKRLGDFPDYAALSGVPLPEPYHAFDISKALPRPYRPFRWAYHQTMCQCMHYRDG